MDGGEDWGRLLRALSTPPHVYIAEEGSPEAREAERALSSLGLWGAVGRARLPGGLVVFYVDVVRLERLCIYEECSRLDGVEAEACISRCVARKAMLIASAAGGGEGGAGLGGGRRRL